LCDDIARDFAYIARGTPEMKGRDPYPGSIRFDAFRNFAADFISLNNPEFGTALKARAEFRRKIDFNFISMGQDYPGINIKAGKREYKITPDPVGDATRVRELAAGNAFDPARDIAVVITAGDWYFAKTFVELYSKAELVIVEPYPCILSAASDVSMFTHYFSENTLVIGIDKSLEYAGQLYRDKINSAAKICLFPALRAEPSITRLIPDAN
jgi:hypothetical protein